MTASKIIFGVAIAACLFTWGMAVGANDTRLLAEYQVMHGCYSMGAISE